MSETGATLTVEDVTQALRDAHCHHAIRTVAVVNIEGGPGWRVLLHRKDTDGRFPVDVQWRVLATELAPRPRDLFRDRLLKVLRDNPLRPFSVV